MCKSGQIARAPVSIATHTDHPDAELLKRKLNPRALEFVSSGSSSDTTSPKAQPCSEADSEEHEGPSDPCDETACAQPTGEYDHSTRMEIPSTNHGQGPSSNGDQQSWGWESPQVGACLFNVI